MSCATAPVFWQRQRRMPLSVMRFLRLRLEEALRDPEKRDLLVWLMIVGSPKQREAYPDGIPEVELIAQSRRILEALGHADPENSWKACLEQFPDTARLGATGWLPGLLWESHVSEVSLRSGVILLALTGQPVDARYRLACAVSLFNMALFHECHDALESLWLNTSGPLKQGLQGLILLAAGFYHQQHHDAPGMLALWRDGLPMLESFNGRLKTPWGSVDFKTSLGTAQGRYDWLQAEDDAVDLERLWEMPRPEWSYT